METRIIEITAYLEGYMECQQQTMNESDAYAASKAATILKYYKLPIYRTALDAVLTNLNS